MGAVKKGASAYFVIDRRQRIIEWSDQASLLLGIPAPRALGRPCFEVVAGCRFSGRAVCQARCPGFKALERGKSFGYSSFVSQPGPGSPLPLTCELMALPRATGGAMGRLHANGRSPESEGGLPPARSSPDILRDLGALARLSTSLSAGALQEDLELALDILRQATGAGGGGIFLGNPPERGG